MTKDQASVTSQLHDLFELLVGRPFLKRAAQWADTWEEWNEDTWRGNDLGVYVLWENQDDLKDGNSPVYVGEGITGSRIWDHFQNREKWAFAQILYDNSIADLNWRKLLERYAIVVLEPQENVG